MTKPLCRIETDHPGDAGPELAAAHDEVGRGDGSVHNLYQVFAIRPKTDRANENAAS